MSILSKKNALERIEVIKRVTPDLFDSNDISIDYIFSNSSFKLNIGDRQYKVSV
jgi:hypothetical protein